MKTLRARARNHIEQGAITPGLQGRPAEAVIKILNEALATEIICVLRYKRHYFMASGHQRARASPAEFLQHANEEQAHADRDRGSASCSSAVSRISSPEGLLPAVAHSEYVEGRR